MVVIEFSRVIVLSLVKRLGIEVNIVYGFIDRLEKEGFVKNVGKGKKYWNIFYKTNIKI